MTSVKHKVGSRCLRCAVVVEENEHCVRLFESNKTNLPTMHDFLAYTNVDVVYRIASENDVPPEVAEEMFRGTLQFLYLASVSDAEFLTPTAKIDLGWHAFLIYTRDYANFCKSFCGRFIHHEPHRIGRSESSTGCLNSTIALAKQTFGPLLSTTWNTNLNAADCESTKCNSACSSDTGGGGNDCTPTSGD